MAALMSRNLIRAINSSLLQKGHFHCGIKKILNMDEPRWNSDLAAFREEFAKARRIVVLTGAGISAESGVPTFRGPGGYWRTYRVQDIATPEAFARNPSLVWELYHYRREVMMTKEPNKAHYAIAACEKRLSKQDRKVTVITQNIDELHRSAGTENLLELHGTLFKTRCVKCGTVREARNNPLVPALQGRGMPEPNANSTPIPEKDLPRCQEDGCDSLVRPHVVWFGESLNDEVLRKTDEELESCDLCLVVGTSSVVYPAAMFAPMLASRGVTVAEFNMEETQATSSLKYHFHGAAGEFVPQALARHESEPVE